LSKLLADSVVTKIKSGGDCTPWPATTAAPYTMASLSPAG